MRADCSCILWVERPNAEDRSKPRGCQEATIKPGDDAHMCFKAIEIGSTWKGSTMRTIICGALLALMITTANAAVEEDVHSAHFMLPYCKLTSKQTMANTMNALIYGQCFGVVSGIVMMAELLRQAGAARKVPLDLALFTGIPGNNTKEHNLSVMGDKG